MIDGAIQVALAFELRPMDGWIWLLLAGIVSIVVALVGVGAILLGHVSAPTASVAAKEPTVDPVVTGSIAAPDKPDEIGRTIEMLDR